MQRTAWIYGLYASDLPDSIRYIGVSVAPTNRFNTHIPEISSSKAFKNNPHKIRWMKDVRSRGASLSFKLLAEFNSEHEAYAAEDSFIGAYRESGHPLTNITKGGRGGCITPDHKLEETYRKRAETLRNPEVRAKMSESRKIWMQKPEVYAKHVEMVRRNGRSEEWRALVRQGQREAAKTNDFWAKGIATKRLPENRERARQRSTELSGTPEAVERSRQAALKQWETRDTTPWNKGLKTAAPKPLKMAVGSEEFRQHARDTTTKYFEELRKDPEKFAEYKKSRLVVGAKVSVSRKAEWANMSDADRKARGHKMSLGKRYNRAKRNGWAFDLTPVQHICKEES